MALNTSDPGRLRRFVEAFFHWWLDGLWYWVPPPLRARLRPQRAVLCIELHEGNVRLTHNDVVGEAVFAVNDAPAISRWIIAHRGPQDIVILAIPRVLRKSLSLPLAVEPDLAAILANELDRQTPFALSQADFDYRVTARDRQARTLRVDLYVVLREVAVAALTTVRAWGVVPDALTPIAAVKSGINLLPVQDSRRQRRRTGTLQSALLGVTLTCLMLALYAPLLTHQRILDTLQVEVTAKRMAAKQTRELMRRYAQMRQQAEFVAELYVRDLTPIAVLDELTQILPDDCTASRLLIDGEVIQIQGEARSATAILALLERSPRFAGAAFRSAVTRDQKADKDKFHIVVNLEAPAQ